MRLRKALSDNGMQRRLIRRARSSKRREMKETCAFCRILSGELESSVVAEDEHAVALLDIGQTNAGHAVVHDGY